jgi:hypothetical protein
MLFVKSVSCISTVPESDIVIAAPLLLKILLLLKLELFMTVFYT